MTWPASRSVRVVSTCTWRGTFFLVSHRVTCRIGNTPPWSSVGTSTTVSARVQVYWRPVSPVKVTSVNISASRSAMVPVRQVSTSNPAAAMWANRAGDHPPRTKPTRTRRWSPTAVRSSGSRRRSSPARDARGSDITTRTGPPSPPAGQVVSGNRGLQLARTTQLGELVDFAADGLDLRGPVQAEHPAQVGRVDPGGALGAGLPSQSAQHALDEHRVQAVEPVRQPVDLVRAAQQAGGLQCGHRQEQPGQRDPGRGGEHRCGALERAPPVSYT